MDKRERAELFRLRVREVMRREGVSRSALARSASADRSTIGQLLNSEDPRLPNAHLAAEIAAALGVSCDWLLGLTDRPERPGDLLAAAMQMTGAGRSAADAQILSWYREAAGYKVRHVPATLPDLLKTEAHLAWEYHDIIGNTPEQAATVARDMEALLLEAQSDHEIALPLHEVESLAAGTGYYATLAPDQRAAQLAHMAALCQRHYPRLRLFLFDRRKLYSAPLTVFGPLLAVLHVGRVHLAFRSADRVRALTEHFDTLVREAAVDARHAADYLRGLAAI
ncbi:MAG: XRE family transcriptional regulator [Alphaproteobacteria bacterium]|nr:MAG: XRE family transcriptional regulator [Alphaproteobacteria bacterium]